jgi:hypothetical protein
MNRDLDALMRDSLDADTPEWLDALVTERVLSVVEREARAKAPALRPVSLRAVPCRRQRGPGRRAGTLLIRVGWTRVSPSVRGLLTWARLAMRGLRASLLGANPGSTKGA